MDLSFNQMLEYYSLFANLFVCENIRESYRCLTTRFVLLSHYRIVSTTLVHMLLLGIILRERLFLIVVKLICVRAQATS